MKTSPTIALYAVCAGLLLGLAGLGYALLKTSATQAEQADQAFSRFSEIDARLSQSAEDRIKRDQRFDEALLDLREDLTASISQRAKQDDTARAEMQKQLQALGQDVQTLQQAQAGLHQEIKAAAKEGESVAGRLDGIRSQLDQQQQAFTQLDQRITGLETPTPPETATVEEFKPEPEAAAEPGEIAEPGGALQEPSSKAE